MDIEEKIKESKDALEKLNKAIEDNKEQAKRLTKTIKEFSKLLEKAKKIES